MNIICPECKTDQNIARQVKKNNKRIGLWGLIMGDRKTGKCPGCGAKFTYYLKITVMADHLERFFR